jgi:hypothetical protein
LKLGARDRLADWVSCAASLTAGVRESEGETDALRTAKIASTGETAMERLWVIPPIALLTMGDRLSVAACSDATACPMLELRDSEADEAKPDAALADADKESDALWVSPPSA